MSVVYSLLSIIFVIFCGNVVLCCVKSYINAEPRRVLLEKDVSGSGVSEILAVFTASQTPRKQLIWLHQSQVRVQECCCTEMWDCQSVTKNTLTF